VCRLHTHTTILCSVTCEEWAAEGEREKGRGSGIPEQSSQRLRGNGKKAEGAGKRQGEQVVSRAVCTSQHSIVDPSACMSDQKLMVIMLHDLDQE